MVRSTKKAVALHENLLFSLADLRKSMLEEVFGNLDVTKEQYCNWQSILEKIIDIQMSVRLDDRLENG